MPVANKLQDLKNQQKKLTEILTAKGVPAVATEKYSSLVDKVAQIEELRGEERTLTSVTSVLSEPKSIVQLEYPEPKTLNAKLGSKNLWQNTNTTFPSTLSYDSNTQTYTMGTGTAGYQFVAHKLDNPIPAGTVVTISAYFQSGKGVQCAFGGYHRTGGRSWQGYLDIPANTDMTGQMLTATFTTTETVEEFEVFHNTGGNVEESYVFQVQYEISSTATTYTPYITDFSTTNVTRCGKNLIPYPYACTTQTISGVTFTVNSDGSVTVNGTATANATFELETDLQMFTLPAADYFLSGCPSGGSPTSYCMAVANGAGISYDKFRRDFGTGIAVPSSGENWKVSIRIMSGYTANNLVFKPQIELGTTATTYEAYKGQTYTPTSTGEVSNITNLYPLTTLVTDNAGVVFEQVLQENEGNTFIEVLPSSGKNGITKINQPIVDSSVDDNITPENIKKDVSILGVTGTYEGSAVPGEVEYTYDSANSAVTIIL